MHRIQIYNSAQLVFLYDEDRLEALRERPPLDDGDVDEDVILSNEGGLVVYDLLEDNELDIGICVGPPLTGEELQGRLWLGIQQTRLVVTSGRLAVESVDAARFLEEAPEDEGAVVEVPPGDYVLTLHRVDLEESWEQAEVDESEPEGPWEVVVLTPAAEVASPPRMAGLLEAEAVLEAEDDDGEAPAPLQLPTIGGSLDERLASDDAGTRYAALKELCAVDSPRAGALVMKMLDGADLGTRNILVQLCYGVLGVAEARPILALLSGDPEQEVRHAAALGLRDLEDLCMDDLAPFLQDSADEVRQVALTTGRRKGVAFTREQLLAVLGDSKDVLLEMEVEDALEELGD